MHAAHGRGGLETVFGERWSEGFVAALDEQALGGLAAPFVAAAEFGDEFGGLESGQALQRRGLVAFGDDAPEAAEVEGRNEAAVFTLLAQVGRK